MDTIAEHLVAAHGYDSAYTSETRPAVLAEQHRRLHEDETAKYLTHSHDPS